MSDLIRVGATGLESFRLHVEEDWMTEERLIASLMYRQPATIEMDRGTALGAILENPDKHRVAFLIDGCAVRGYQHGDHFFADSDEMTRALLMMAHGNSVFEVKNAKQYGGLLVVSKADRLTGGVLAEHKSSDTDFDYDKRADSYQWRYMADIFDPLWVEYNDFQLGPDKDIGKLLTEIFGADAPYAWTIRKISVVTFPKYRRLHRDCLELAERFEQFVRHRPELASFLIGRQRDSIVEGV